MKTDTGLDEHKYVVLKGDAWEKWLAGRDPEDLFPLPAPLDPETYFVLRSSDIAGHLGLSAWVEGLYVLMDAAELSDDDIQALLDVAADAHELLMRWRAEPLKKIPD